MHTSLDIQHEDSATLTDIQDWVFLRAQNLRMLLPQSALISIDNLNETLHFDKATGFLYKSENSDEVVLVPSEHLEPLSEKPQDRYLITALNSGDALPFSWCWSEVVLYNERSFNFYDLPATFMTESSVFQQFTVIDGEVVFLADSMRLHDFILVQSMESVVDIEHGGLAE